MTGANLWAGVKLIALHGPVVWLAWAAARRLMPEDGLARAVAGLVIYFGAIGASAWWGGMAFSLGSMLGWSWLLGALGGWMWWKDSNAAPATRPEPVLPPYPALAGAIAVGGLALALLVTGLVQPRFDHDPLTYQLHFAAQWLRAGKIFVVPTPFGDPAQAWAPSLASVFNAWLMAPLGSDLLAANGGWAFVPVMLLAAVGLARELSRLKALAQDDESRLTSLAPLAAALVMLSPMVVYEGWGAQSDGAAAGFFAAALYFFVRAIKKKDAGCKPAALTAALTATQPAAQELALGLVAAGLMCGVKHGGVLLVALLIATYVARTFSWRGALTGTAGAVCGGGFWYVRNWWVTGNPIYPLEVKLGGATVFAGLYGRQQMAGWMFHYKGAAAWWSAVGANWSPLAVLAAVIGMGALAWAGLRRMKTDRLGGASLLYAALLPLLMDRLIWHVFPYQESRFWLVLAPVAGAVMVAGLGRPGLIYAALAAAYAGLFLVKDRLPVAEVWNWLEIGAPVAVIVAMIATYVARTLLAAKGARTIEVARLKIAPKGARTITILLMMVLGLGLIAIVVIGSRGWEERRAEALMKWELGPVWMKAPSPKGGATVAYTGANLPYPLAGPRLANRVIYVSPAGIVNDSDFPHLAGRGAPPAFMTPEPELNRLIHRPTAWAEALVHEQADYLVVMRVGGAELLNVAHDLAGWPLEDVWARSCPGLFVPVHEDRYARVYQIDRARTDEISNLSSLLVTQPPDAVEVCQDGKPECEQFFPLAKEAMKWMSLQR
jgi:hypothetical protein